MKRTVQQTTLILIASAGFLIGVGLARTGTLIDASWILLLGLVVLFRIRRRVVLTAIMILLCAVSLGWWRGSVYMQHLARFNAYFGQKITILATASEDATYNKYKELTYDIHNARISDTGEVLHGKISISGYGARAVFAGDTVRVTAKLKPSLGSYQGRMTYATTEIIERGSGIIPELRRRFVAGMQNALPEPLASFGMGLLIGQRANLPDQVYQSLLMVGLVHIIAVSGYNLTIILRASKGLLSKYSRRMSLLLAFSLIGVFLLFTGASASIVRAAIVSGLAVLAAYYGRQVKPMVLIMLAAAITGWLNPYYVWSDAGWYLSFLAFFGVMIVAPLLLVRLPERWQSSLVLTIALESLCAELMTMPYILHTFGQVSFVGLAANVLVVALVPLAMLFCMVAGIVGMLAPALVGWIAWPATLLLTYMLNIAELLSRIPHIFMQGLRFSIAEMLLVYAAVVVFVLSLWRKLTRTQLETINEQAIGSLPKQG